VLISRDESAIFGTKKTPEMNVNKQALDLARYIGLAVFLLKSELVGNSTFNTFDGL
jgi:hypothetical protein